MRDINSIVDFEKHPINDKDYIKKCNALIKKNSLLVLENFLLIDSLEKILKETKSLEDKAFYCDQKHTILLNKQSPDLDMFDPINQLMTSDKGCVPHDLISEKSDLNLLYNSNTFKDFLKYVLELDQIFPYADNLSSINLNYYQKGQQLGWHFDNASFAITLMIQSAPSIALLKSANSLTKLFPEINSPFRKTRAPPPTPPAAPEPLTFCKSIS